MSGPPDPQIDNLARILDVSPADLRAAADAAPASYQRYSLPKPDGRRRWITAPVSELKALQRRLLEKVLYTRPAHPAAHGFVPGRSIVTNARCHLRQRWIAGFDISGFFPGTRSEAVRRVLDGYPELAGAAGSLALRLVCLEDALPQGAPTSPHLANRVMIDCDVALSRGATREGLIYTRYADDLTFSGPSLPKDLTRQVRAVLAGAGYRLAERKTRRIGAHRCQMVTGLVVNDRLGLPRPLRRRLRAVLHDARTRGIDAALARSDDLSWDRLHGLLALQAMWDRRAARQALEELYALSAPASGAPAGGYKRGPAPGSS